jgi:predicted RNase H-like HicB family nuclease
MVYYCTVEKKGCEYIVQFSDMPNMVTCGFTHEEAIAMARKALDGCIEVDVFHRNEIPHPACKNGFPVSVASHIVLSLKFRELRGNQSQTKLSYGK